MSLQTKFAAFIQLANGQRSQVMDNMRKSLTLCMRSQETCDIYNGWTMFHIVTAFLLNLPNAYFTLTEKELAHVSHAPPQGIFYV
jgi:hypothetical protein